MRKLTDEQLHQISNEVFHEMFPEYTDQDEHEFKTNLLNTILTAIIKFVDKYQQEIDK